MMKLGLLDSSRKITPIHEKDFANKFRLVLHARIRLFMKKISGCHPNTANVREEDHMPRASDPGRHHSLARRIHFWYTDTVTPFNFSQSEGPSHASNMYTVLWRSMAVITGSAGFVNKFGLLIRLWQRIIDINQRDKDPLNFRRKAWKYNCVKMESPYMQSYCMYSTVGTCTFSRKCSLLCLHYYTEQQMRKKSSLECADFHIEYPLM